MVFYAFCLTFNRKLLYVLMKEKLETQKYGANYVQLFNFYAGVCILLISVSVYYTLQWVGFLYFLAFSNLAPDLNQGSPNTQALDDA